MIQTEHAEIEEEGRFRVTLKLSRSLGRKGIDVITPGTEHHSREFVKRFQSRFGAHRVTDAPIEAAYTAVHLWAGAVRSAENADVHEVRKAVRRQAFDAPEGRVWVDQLNQHVWKLSRIAKIQPNGQFRIEWVSDTLIHPVPYPPTRRIQGWQDLLSGLYTEWNGNWARPVPRPKR